MMQPLLNIARLGIKELASLARDPVMIALIVYSFTIAVYTVASGVQTEVKDASVAIVDGDGSALSRRIADAIQPPYFQVPRRIDRREVDDALDRGTVTFVLDLPPRLEADLLAGRQPEIGLYVDATAMTQAGVGSQYLQSIITAEARGLLIRQGRLPPPLVRAVVRVYFNQNLESFRFSAVMQVMQSVTILALILVGAAVMRERERGTIEHLLVMPVSSAEIALAKIWANGLVVLVASGLSLVFVVQVLLQVPIAGSLPLFLFGTAIYLFAVTALGIFLATLVNSMPQFGLVSIPVFVVMNLLSGTTTPQEAMPDWLRLAMQASPSTHFVSLAQSVLYRGAGLDAVSNQLLGMAVLGLVFLLAALTRFRAMLAPQA
jgi:ABC-2 type transport system permease protein